MAKFKVLAGDFPKGNADFNDVCMMFPRSGSLPGKVYFIDVESYSVQDGGVIELQLFNGLRLLIEQNDAFLKTIKTALFDQPQDIELRRQQWQQRQANGGTKVKQPLTIGKIFWWGLGGFVALGLLGNCVGGKGTATGNYVEKQKQVKAEKKVPDDVLAFQYTKKAYPKLYRQWGDTGVKKINTLMPKAALAIAKESTCDRVEMVDVSDARSKPGKQIVFFVDCANKKRFFISENEINAGANVAAEQDKKFDSAAAVKQCDNAIKAQLNNPGTFSGHITDTLVSKNANGNIVVTRGFTAKNGMGMKIDYQARCVLSPDLQIAQGDLQITQK